MEEVAEKKEEDGEVKEETVEQRRMTKRLRDPIRVNVEGRSTKVNLNSFKSMFLSLKNKVSTMQVEVGTEPDFVIIMKKNLQDPNVNNPAETAGKYMVYAEAFLKKELLENGIKYKQGETYLIANNFDYKEKKVEEVEEDNV